MLKNELLNSMKLTISFPKLLTISKNYYNLRDKIKINTKLLMKKLHS